MKLNNILEIQEKIKQIEEEKNKLCLENEKIFQTWNNFFKIRLLLTEINNKRNTDYLEKTKIAYTEIKKIITEYEVKNEMPK